MTHLAKVLRMPRRIRDYCRIAVFTPGSLILEQGQHYRSLILIRAGIVESRPQVPTTTAVTKVIGVGESGNGFRTCVLGCGMALNGGGAFHGRKRQAQAVNPSGYAHLWVIDSDRLSDMEKSDLELFVAVLRLATSCNSERDDDRWD